MAIRRKKVTLYFGSFNPIHVGHMALADFIVDNDIADEVWLVVSPHNPLKDKNSLWNDDFRLNLVCAAVASADRIKVSDVEFYLPQPNYTINTLEFLSKNNPETEFSLLIGADNLAIFDKWYRYEDIIAGYRLYVYPRPDAHPDLSRFPEVCMIDAPLYDISSTEIRCKIENGESVADMVPEAIVNEMEKLRKFHLHSSK